MLHSCLKSIALKHIGPLRLVYTLTKCLSQFNVVTKKCEVSVMLISFKPRNLFSNNLKWWAGMLPIMALMLICDCSVLLSCYLLRYCSKLDEIRKIKWLGCRDYYFPGNNLISTAHRWHMSGCWSVSCSLLDSRGGVHLLAFATVNLSLEIFCS